MERKRGSAKSVREGKTSLAEKGLNDAERSVVEKVASRVLAQEFGQKGADTEPLLWVLHGGPGTGKSFVIDKIAAGARQFKVNKLHQVLAALVREHLVAAAVTMT